MNNTVKLSTEPAQIEIVLRVARGKVVSHERMLPHRPGWTPAPDPRQYIKVDPYRGRDYEALTKAAKRKPVGWWGDEPKENPSEWPPKLPDESEPACEGPSPSAPQPADSWPRCIHHGEGVYVYTSERSGRWYTDYASGVCAKSYSYYANPEVGSSLTSKAIRLPEALVWLRAHGHAAEADKWEPKPATIRAWRHTRVDWVGIRTGDGKEFYRARWLRSDEWFEFVGPAGPIEDDCVELPADEAIRLNEERLKHGV